MRWVKYFFSAICIILAIGTLPSVILIAEGLIGGQTDDPAYFTGKLVGYLLIITLLIFLSIKLLREQKN